MVGGRRDFRLGSFEKLLVSAVHEFGDFTADQITGIREYFHAIIAIFLNRRRAIVFLEEHTALHFFFQAEDGIRDIGVTGVQTCALPISRRRTKPARGWRPSTMRSALRTSTARR